MAKVTITLEDTADGEFQASTDYGDFYDGRSHAHQFGHLLMQQLGQWAVAEGDEQRFGNAPSNHAGLAGILDTTMPPDHQPV